MGVFPLSAGRLMIVRPLSGRLRFSDRQTRGPSLLVHLQGASLSSARGGQLSGQSRDDDHAVSKPCPLLSVDLLSDALISHTPRSCVLCDLQRFVLVQILFSGLSKKVETAFGVPCSHPEGPGTCSRPGECWRLSSCLLPDVGDLMPSFWGQQTSSCFSPSNRSFAPNNF